ncbi:MAG: hypothetical protein AAF446_11600 [Pseudomonadota bacterium]
MTAFKKEIITADESGYAQMETDRSFAFSDVDLAAFSFLPLCFYPRSSAPICGKPRVFGI